MRSIMFVMPVASDTHRHSYACPSIGGGPGNGKAHNSGEKASDDQWEIKRALPLTPISVRKGSSNVGKLGKMTNGGHYYGDGAMSL